MCIKTTKDLYTGGIIYKMERYEIIEAPPLPRTFVVIDNSIDGYAIGQFETEEDADQFIQQRKVTDRIVA